MYPKTEKIIYRASDALRFLHQFRQTSFSTATDVYDKMFSDDGAGDHMWVKLIWNEFDNRTIYGST
jgi:hypothetical protein